MLRLQATAADPAPAEHGEGPVWDGTALHWLDITAGLVRHGSVAADGTVTERGAPQRGGDTVGVVVPAAAGGWLLGADDGFTHLAPDGTARVLVQLAGEGGSPDSGGTRMNDGACDRAGRFYAGTMAFDEHSPEGSLYRLGTDGVVTTVLTHLTISNGMDWSPDDRTVYLCDSGGDPVVWAFPYDLATGEFGPRREFLRFDGTDGVADGLTVDDEGCVWTAMWGGGAVRRWSPDGELLAVVDVPTRNTSSCCFAGPDRDVLVISTSRHGLDDAARAAQPDAGRLFVARPGVTGPPSFPYRGPVTGVRQ